MALGEDEIKELIVAKKDGAFESALGPCALGGERIYEVWVTKDEGVYYNRYVVERRQGDPLYFERFEKLAYYLNEQRTRTEDHLKKFSAYVAAAAFLLTVIVLLYMVVTGGGNTPTMIVTAVLGIVASGSVLFFGKWVPFKTQ
jgi:hypothetical protein